MIKTRIIPTLLYKDFTLVKSIKFDSWRRVGSLLQAVKVYSLREVDELIFLDINATPQAQPPDLNLIDDFADECFMPLTVGGGVSTVEDIGNILRAGADKVAVNTAAAVSPGVIRDAVKKFGSQCIVVSIDAKKDAGGGYQVFVNSGRRPIGKDPVAFAREAQKLGAGEILLTSIDRDGTMSGYDIGLIRSVTEAVSIPVIASGGAGSCEHMLEAIKDAKASAVSAASIFHFTQITPLDIKQFLDKNGVRVRI